MMFDVLKMPNHWLMMNQPPKSQIGWLAMTINIWTYVLTYSATSKWRLQFFTISDVSAVRDTEHESNDDGNTVTHRFQWMEIPNIIPFVNTGWSEFVLSMPFQLNGLYLFIEKKNRNPNIWMILKKKPFFYFQINFSNYFVETLTMTVISLISPN